MTRLEGTFDARTQRALTLRRGRRAGAASRVTRRKADAAPARLRPNRQPLWRRVVQKWPLYALIAPALVHLAVFKLWPLYGVQIAFRDYNPVDGFAGSTWVGWEHLARFFASPQFERVLTNTVQLGAINLVVAFPIPIVLALMVVHLRSGRVRAVVQAVIYAPAFISVVVVVGMLHVLLSPRSGLVNHVLIVLGQEPILFFGSPEWFRPMFVGSSVWQESGFNMVIFIAALAAVDPSLHEAAKIDGASVWQRMRHIDLPGIAPTVLVLFLLAVGNLLNLSFEKALLMQTNLNLETSQVIQTYVYQVGLQQAQFSYSAAIGLFNSFLNLCLLVTLYVVLARVRRRYAV